MVFKRVCNYFVLKIMSAKYRLTIFLEVQPRTYWYFGRGPTLDIFLSSNANASRSPAKEGRTLRLAIHL